jgi:PadR family transcriptional regulator, regulatory protein PadR
MGLKMNNDEMWETQLYKGTLELCMLALLAREEHYGYEITQALNQDDGLGLSEGTIYPLLTRLQREGMISSRWQESRAGPPRKYYRLTEKGMQALESMSLRWTSLTRQVNSILKEANNGRK